MWADPRGEGPCPPTHDKIFLVLYYSHMHCFIQSRIALLSTQVAVHVMGGGWWWQGEKRKLMLR